MSNLINIGLNAKEASYELGILSTIEKDKASQIKTVFEF